MDENGKLIRELELQKGANAAQDERERKAGELCGVPYELGGCDWPDLVADEVLTLRHRIDVLNESLQASNEALHRIKDWADAYPLDVFPDQDLKKADRILADKGISMSAMHGQWARHIVEGIGKIATGVLNGKANEHPTR